MKSTALHFKPADALYGRLRSYLNKVLHAEIEGLGSSGLIVLPPQSMFEAKYLSFCPSTDGFVAFANHLNQGNRPRVSFDQIEARFDKARQQVAALTPSLLARAFSGKLVPQDPANEPASALLERINSQAKHTDEPKPRKRK